MITSNYVQLDWIPASYHSPGLSILTYFHPQRKAEKAAPAPKATRAKKDPKAPKRPLSAYMFFSQDWRERVKTENPNASFGEIGKLLGAKWKELSDEEKKVGFLPSRPESPRSYSPFQPYIEQAASDKTRAESEKAAYNVSAFLSLRICSSSHPDHRTRRARTRVTRTVKMTMMSNLALDFPYWISRVNHQHNTLALRSIYFDCSLCLYFIRCCVCVCTYCRRLWVSASSLHFESLRP
jgi:hypothetical protein